MSGVRCVSRVRVWNWSQNKVFNGYFIFEKGASGFSGNP